MAVWREQARLTDPAIVLGQIEAFGKHCESLADEAEANGWHGRAVALQLMAEGTVTRAQEFVEWCCAEGIA